MAKCKLCPYRKFCRDACYGDNPCAFASAFDGLARKLDRQNVCIESLKAENKDLKDWKEIAEGYQKQFEDSYDRHQKELAKVKSEVAREIFEEIEKIMQKGEERIYYKAEFGELITREPDEVISCGRFRLSEFDALKKKYTEGQK